MVEEESKSGSINNVAMHLLYMNCVYVEFFLFSFWSSGVYLCYKGP